VVAWPCAYDGEEMTVAGCIAGIYDDGEEEQRGEKSSGAFIYHQATKEVARIRQLLLTHA